MWKGNSAVLIAILRFLHSTGYLGTCSFLTHVDRNFFAYFGAGNTQEKFVT